MYDPDDDDVGRIGWEEFIARQWESVFAAYRSWAGLRTVGRRWSDLLEAGLGCTQAFADRLVKAEVIDKADRVMGVADAETIVSAMVAVLTDVRTHIAGMAGLEPHVANTLLDRHAQLLSFLLVHAFGEDAGEVTSS
ncbi:MAG TPA: hypothetical protein VGS19_04290 [Streptosporangiaceae bacterium]|nr:hypothetical protein [Streptosporangiaceae bacterium]